MLDGNDDLTGFLAAYDLHVHLTCHLGALAHLSELGGDARLACTDEVGLGEFT